MLRPRLSLLVLLAACGSREPAPPPGAAPTTPEWQACSEAQECTVLRWGCLTRAVNVEYEAEQFEDMRSFTATCADPIGGRWLTPVARCEASRCTATEAEDAVVLPTIDWGRACSTPSLEDSNGPVRLRVQDGPTAIGTLRVQPAHDLVVEAFENEAPEARVALLLRLVLDANASGSVRYRTTDQDGDGSTVCSAEASKNDPVYAAAVQSHLESYGFRIRVLRD
ncbi:MAG: hypothetical protein AAF411_13725 [Myxococcota bacterium]